MHESSEKAAWPPCINALPYLGSVDTAGNEDPRKIERYNFLERIKAGSKEQLWERKGGEELMGHRRNVPVKPVNPEGKDAWIPAASPVLLLAQC